MKKYISIFVFFSLCCCISCTKRKQVGDVEENVLPVPSPDSIDADYSYLDSLDFEIKKASMELYGDSNMLDILWERGLPDSMKLHNE